MGAPADTGHANRFQLLADRACSDPSGRKQLRGKGIKYTYPEWCDQIARRQAKGAAGGHGRPSTPAPQGCATSSSPRVRPRVSAVSPSAPPRSHRNIREVTDDLAPEGEKNQGVSSILDSGTTTAGSAASAIGATGAEPAEASTGGVARPSAQRPARRGPRGAVGQIRTARTRASAISSCPSCGRRVVSAGPLLVVPG